MGIYQQESTADATVKTAALHGVYVGRRPVSEKPTLYYPSIFRPTTYTEVMNRRELPDSFKRNVLGAFPNGAAWLDSLPSLITECETRWQISVGAPFELSYNFIAAATTATGTEVVLKIGVPNPELNSEIQALKTYAGRGAVRLLESDEDRGLLLMERLVPGEMLYSLTDDKRRLELLLERCVNSGELCQRTIRFRRWPGGQKV